MFVYEYTCIYVYDITAIHLALYFFVLINQTLQMFVALSELQSTMSCIYRFVGCG